MYKKHVFTGLKVLVIFFLVIGIAFLIMIQWKSDTVIRKAVSLIQHRMEDSLIYKDISLEWFRHFPSASLHIDGLNIGKDQKPFIQGGSVDVVLRLFPLLKEKIIINKLIITNCTLHVTKHKGRWTYDLLKKTEEKKDIHKADVSASDDSKWKALVSQLVFVNTVVIYNNKEGTDFNLYIKDGQIDGNLTGDLFDSEIDISATLDSL